MIRDRGKNGFKRPADPPPKPNSDNPVESRISRESSERQRAMELIERKRRERERGGVLDTPTSVADSEGGYRDVYNRQETEDAHRRWGHSYHQNHSHTRGKWPMRSR
jgi:hypothetical protein